MRQAERGLDEGEEGLGVPKQIIRLPRSHGAHGCPHACPPRAAKKAAHSASSGLPAAAAPGTAWPAANRTLLGASPRGENGSSAAQRGQVGGGIALGWDRGDARLRQTAPSEQVQRGGTRTGWTRG